MFTRLLISPAFSQAATDLVTRRSVSLHSLEPASLNTVKSAGGGGGLLAEFRSWGLGYLATSTARAVRLKF